MSINLMQLRSEGPKTGVWLVELADTARRNAMDDNFALELEYCFREVRTNGGKAVFIMSAGPAFCSGADLKQPSGAAVAKILSTVARSDVPVVACVDGPAVGAGAALVGVCTFAVMSSDSWIQLPEVATLNRFPTGVIRWMKPCVDFKVLMRIAATAERLDARRAEEVGWVTESVNASQFRNTIECWQRRFSELDAEILFEMQRQWVVGKASQWPLSSDDSTIQS